MTRLPPHELPWNDLPSGTISTMTMAGLKQHYKRRPLVKGAKSACPICNNYRDLFGQGVCTDCFKVGCDKIGHDLLTALSSIVPTTEVCDITTSSDPWYPIPAEALPTLTLREIWRYWRHRPVINTNQKAPCPNCQEIAWQHQNGLCKECVAVVGVKRGPELVAALLTRAVKIKAVQQDVDHDSKSNTRPKVIGKVDLPVSQKSSKSQQSILPPAATKKKEFLPTDKDIFTMSKQPEAKKNQSSNLEKAQYDQPVVKKAMILDYGKDELELRGTPDSIDLYIRDDEGVVWGIKNITGPALLAIKDFLQVK